MNPPCDSIGVSDSNLDPDHQQIDVELQQSGNEDEQLAEESTLIGDDPLENDAKKGRNILIEVKEHPSNQNSSEEEASDSDDTTNYTNSSDKNPLKKTAKQLNDNRDSHESDLGGENDRNNSGVINVADSSTENSDAELNINNKHKVITIEEAKPQLVLALAAGDNNSEGDIDEIPGKMEKENLQDNSEIPMIDNVPDNEPGIITSVEGDANVMEMKEKKDNSDNAANGQTENKPADDNRHLSPDGKDTVDAASVYSLYMEKDFRYYFQHPYLRIFIAYFVVFCNFLIYAEDPVAHSVKECNIPVIGNCFAFVFTRYPPNAWSLLKVILWLSAIIIGMVIGKVLVHSILFVKIFRLKMFSDDQGSWMTMFMTTLITVFIMSYIYNGFLMIGGDATEPYRISVLLGLSNSIFMKAAACGTWCGDFFTAWMVTDIMLQEKLYPHWAVPVRTWWKKGYNRIILFWIMVFVTSFVVIFFIGTDYIVWDKLNRGFLPTNELSRAFLASFILVMDITIVMQDWDFPHFISAFDIKLPGINIAHIRFEIPSFLRKENWQVHISGKWFNYGILFIVILLDLNMWKNQIFYSPYDYGQYASPDERIHTVLSTQQLDMFNKTLLTYDFRNQTTNPLTNETYINEDTVMFTLYKSFSLGVVCIAFIPSVTAFLILGILIWMYGRYPAPTKENPYGGRLKKRKKRRFSLRSIANSFRRKSKSHSKGDAKLLKYTERNESKAKLKSIAEHPDTGDSVQADDVPEITIEG